MQTIHFNKKILFSKLYYLGIGDAKAKLSETNRFMRTGNKMWHVLFKLREH